MLSGGKQRNISLSLVKYEKVLGPSTACHVKCSQSSAHLVGKCVKFPDRSLLASFLSRERLLVRREFEAKNLPSPRNRC
jgi:hypothetical protein